MISKTRNIKLEFFKSTRIKKQKIKNKKKEKQGETIQEKTRKTEIKKPKKPVL